MLWYARGNSAEGAGISSIVAFESTNELLEYAIMVELDNQRT